MPPPTETLLAVLRRTDGLFALVGDVVDGAPSCRSIPLAPNHDPDRLLQAWQGLASVREATAATSAAVEAILDATRLDPLGDAPATEQLRIGAPPPPHRPTAANPRAYKGTKDRPPKPPRPAPQDLRLSLCSYRGQDALTGRLIARHGFRERGVLQEHRTAPPGFRRYLSWLLREAPKLHKNMLALFHSLGLDHDEPLLQLVALVAARHDPEAALSWCRTLELVDPPDRAPLLAAAFAADATADGVAAPDRSVFAAIARRCRGERAATRRQFLMRARVSAEQLDCVLAGFELADSHQPSFTFAAPPASRRAAAAVAAIPVTHVANAGRLWELCRDRPGLDALLASIAWREIEPADARATPRTARPVLTSGWSAVARCG